MNTDYTVLAGDSPSKIASKLGVPFADLIAANPGKGTIVVSSTRTWSSLVPGEIVRVPTASTGLSEVQITAAHAFDVLSADASYCESVRHAGTPVNVAVHNFKQAWNAANPGNPLPIGTGRYEPSVRTALFSVLKHIDLTDVPLECGSRAMVSMVRNTPKTHVWSGVVAGLGDPVQGDALFTAAQTLLTALSNSPGYPTVVSCSDTTVAAAAGAFQSAFNAAPTAGNTSAPNTGVYDAATQLALQSTINTYQALSPPVSFTSGSAPKPCGAGAGAGAGGHHHKTSVATVPPPPVVDSGIEFPDTTPPSPPAPPVAPPPPAPPAPPAPPVVVQVPPAPPVSTDGGSQEYVVQTGDSPEIISRRLGVPFVELIRANPHKPHVHVGGGVHTWRTLTRGERLRVPAHRGRGRLGLAAAESAGLVSLATAAVAALNADPKHCESVRRPGTHVNKAVHEFKKAWNEVNPQKRIPVGTGKYETSVADALNTITSGMAPPGCGEKNMPQYHRPESPRMAMRPAAPHFEPRPQPPTAYGYHYPSPPVAYRRPEPPHGYRLPEPPHGYRLPPMLPAPPGGWGYNNPPPVDDWGDAPDATDDAVLPAPATTPVTPPPTAAPDPGPAASADTAAAPPAPPAAPAGDAPPPDDSGNHKEKHKEKHKENEEAEGLSTGAKIGIGVGIVTVLGGIVAVVASKKKKPAGAR